MNEEYKLISLETTQSIPINWKFTQEEYEKMVIGHRSNWCIFLRDEVVHVCRVGGEEFYRFKLNRLNDYIYTTSHLETYVTDGFNQAAVASGWTESQIQAKKADFNGNILEEVSGLLSAYFDIVVDIQEEIKIK